jgi:hypothetical protein
MHPLPAQFWSCLEQFEVESRRSADIVSNWPWNLKDVLKVIINSKHVSKRIFHDLR